MMRAVIWWVLLAVALAAFGPKPTRFYIPDSMDFEICKKTPTGASCRPAAIVGDFLLRDGNETCPE